MLSFIEKSAHKHSSLNAWKSYDKNFSGHKIFEIKEAKYERVEIDAWRV